MKTLKENSLLIFGYIMIGFGALSAIDDLVKLIRFSPRYDLGVALADGAICLIGLVTIAVAGHLKELARRLDKIESRHSSS